MFKNYATIIFRQILKNKLYTAINVIGLAFGMATCLVIYQYVGFHNSFDTFYSEADKIYRLEQTVTSGTSESSVQTGHAAPLGTLLSQRSPQVTLLTRIASLNYLNASLSSEQQGALKIFKQPGLVILEKSFFDVFDHPFVAGNAESFDQPYKAILSKSALVKFFDNPEEAVGKSFTLKGNTGDQVYQLVGVMEDLPRNSHFSFQMALSLPSAEKYLGPLESWDSPSFKTYVLLDDSENAQKVSTTANDIYADQFADKLSQSENKVNYALRNVQNIHFSKVTASGDKPAVDKNIIIILSLVAIVVLAVAWINYLNLSLVRTLERMKEMGVRQCLGSSKSQLVYLFLTESLIINMLALVFAVLLVNLAGSFLSQATGLPALDVTSPGILLFLFAVASAGTLITGLYPLILIKSIDVVTILVGKRGKAGGTNSRKALVVFQFCVTFMLVAGTLAIFRQVGYMRNADLGIKTENILSVKAPPSDVNADNRQTRAKFRTMTTELLKYPGIEAMTSGGEVPGQSISWQTRLKTNTQSDDQQVSTGLISMNLGYTDFFGIDLVAGRNLQEGDDPWSRGDVVINEQLANQLGFSNPEDAIGAKLEGFFAPLQVRGVLENHHHTSLHNNYQPIAYILSGWTRYYFFRLKLDENSDNKTEDLQTIVAKMQSEWDQVFPNYQMEYSFVDQVFDQQYKEDVRFGEIFTGFSVITIIIACMGLFGLTALTVNQRIKEVGIRKVLGASGFNLMTLLSKQYAIMVLVSGVLSMPLAYYLMNEWLNSFSFRIGLGTWFFAIPFIFVFALAVLSVAGKILNVVKSNPIDALRYE